MKKILIIDDEEKIRTAYRSVLMAEGFEILEARDVAQGLSEMFRHQDIDLILLDIKMPAINGGRIMNVIDDYGLTFKVIVSSVYPVDEQRNFVPFADDYFDKVQGVDVLINKVRTVLGCAV